MSCGRCNMDLLSQLPPTNDLFANCSRQAVYTPITGRPGLRKPWERLQGLRKAGLPQKQQLLHLLYYFQKLPYPQTLALQNRASDKQILQMATRLRVKHTSSATRQLLSLQRCRSWLPAGTDRPRSRRSLRRLQPPLASCACVHLCSRSQSSAWSWDVTTGPSSRLRHQRSYKPAAMEIRVVYLAVLRQACTLRVRTPALPHRRAAPGSALPPSHPPVLYRLN